MNNRLSPLFSFTFLLFCLGCEAKAKDEDKGGSRYVKDTTPALQSTTSKKKQGYAYPEYTETELAAELKKTCQKAQEKGQPLLIEFSAPWCSDCRKLNQMKKEPVLAQALSKQTHSVVNIGHFDRHEALLEHYRVKAIAQWSLVDSSQCEASASTWRILKQRTLEPRSGKKVTPRELARWLQ